MTIEDRFWKYISPEPNTGCWLWTGGATNNRYGQFNLQKGKVINAHRLSFQMYIGPIPSRMHVCHKCDVPLCVNPEHLFLGTRSDNMKDCVNKGRQNKIRNTHCPKGHPLTPDNLVSYIKEKRACKICTLKSYRDYNRNRRHRKLKEKDNGLQLE